MVVSLNDFYNQDLRKRLTTDYGHTLKARILLINKWIEFVKEENKKGLALTYHQLKQSLKEIVLKDPIECERSVSLELPGCQLPLPNCQVRDRFTAGRSKNTSLLRMVITRAILRWAPPDLP